jgi:surface protein
MQVIKITSLTGHSPYNITICDITNTYCYSGITGATTVPLTINVPTQLLGTQELLVVITDSIGCQEIQYHNCGEFIPSQTPTPTPTITPTNLTCNCISIQNPSGITLNFGYTQCDGTLFYGKIYSATTLYVCGRLPYGDTGLIINVSTNVCVNDECPGPTPTPTTTPTPTPTLPPIVGYFRDVCNTSYQFKLSNIPSSFSPLTGVYYIVSDGFVGCALYLVASTTTNSFSYISMTSQPSIPYCLRVNFSYPCPTLTPTPTITPTHTPTPTVTITSTPPSTPTQTPTPSTQYILFQVLSCCNKIVKYMMLPITFLPGTVVLNTLGECYQIISKSSIRTFVTDYWDHGTTYLDCSLCIKYNTCTPPPPPSFISVWVTTTPSESIILPYETTGSYSGTIDWGDGATSINSYSNRSHTYTTPGTYTITITGTLIGWSFVVNPFSNNKIYQILQWGCLRLGNSGGNFYICGNLTLSNVTDVLNLDGTYNLSLMFESCYSITNIPNINSWNTSNVTDMSYMFQGAESFNDNIGNWDVSNVITMNSMFDTALLFNNGGSTTISNWDTSNVTDMSHMFLVSSMFNQPLSGWNVSNVIDMGGMFEDASSFNQNIGGWNVKNVSNFFAFMDGKTFSDYSTTNLDSIYNGWSSLPSLHNGVNISFGTIKHTTGSNAGKAILTGTYGWTITDGGV